MADMRLAAVAETGWPKLDPLFRAAADAVEQAIYHALWHASSVVGRDGQRRWAWQDLWKDAE